MRTKARQGWEPGGNLPVCNTSLDAEHMRGVSGGGGDGSVGVVGGWVVRGSRWVSHLVEGGEAGEMKRSGSWGGELEGFMGKIHACLCACVCMFEQLTCRASGASGRCSRGSRGSTDADR